MLYIGFGIFVVVTLAFIVLAAWYCPHELVWPMKGETEGEYVFICARCKAVERKVGKEWKWIRR
jgi:hypothetical protein